MAAIALGFASAVMWGAADFLGGLKSRQLALLTVLLGSQAAGLGVVLVAAAVRGEGPPGADIVPFVILTGIAGTVGLAAFYRALSVGRMGVVAPISASAAAIPVAVGVIGGERPSALQFAGVALAIAGVAIASYEPEEEPPAERAVAGGSRFRTTTGAGLALVAAVGFGLFFVGLDEASDRDLVWALVFGRVISMVILTLTALVLRPSFAMTRADARDIALVGLLDVGANALFAAGTTLGLVSIVSVLGSLYPVTTIILARIVLGERLHRAQRGGAAGALAGVALISAG